jgi:saccharopine dehydrogenase (NAD+, L-lysine forming)
MKIAIIREGKTPPDHRMPLLPWQCRQLHILNPDLEFVIQKSKVRCISDQMFAELGLQVQDDVSDADVFMGIKEVNMEDLLPNKTYFFFSHTIKKQAYNREMLREILNRNIRLIDYECLTDELGSRVVAFGRFAGIVGTYNAILAYGKRFGLFDLKPAHQCRDLKEMKDQFKYIQLPPVKIVVTGTGRVGKGAKEVLDLMKIKQVFPQEFLRDNFHEPVYTILRSDNYYVPKREDLGENLGFYTHPESYRADFLPYTHVSDVFISTHYWNPKAEALFTKADVREPNFKIKVIADITCDISGSIPTTLRSTNIGDACYDYNPITEQEEPAYHHERNITVMAVDNLPCELPLDASETFGEQLMQWVFPALLKGDKDKLLENATIAQNGKLMPKFNYLADYVANP